MQLARARTTASAAAATARLTPCAPLGRRVAASASSTRSSAAPAPAAATTPRRLAPSAPHAQPRRAVVSTSATTPSTTAPGGTDTDQQKRRREALLRVVRDLYSTLYDFDDLSITALVSPEVVLEDDALQVALQGPESVGDYLRWLHAGVDAGEPATATIDAAPLEKAILAGAEAVLADEMAAAAQKAGFAIHGHESEREDCVIATWVAGEDGEVRGRDEFFFPASAGAGSGTSDPPIVRIHTSRVTATTSG